MFLSLSFACVEKSSDDEDEDEEETYAGTGGDPWSGSGGTGSGGTGTGSSGTDGSGTDGSGTGGSGDDGSGTGGSGTGGSGGDGSGTGGSGTGGSGDDGGDGDDSVAEDPDGHLGGLGDDGFTAGEDDGGSTHIADGSFDIDSLFVYWDEAYRYGEPADAVFMSSDGEVSVASTKFTFAWVDTEDYVSGDEDYICRLSYDMDIATSTSFSGMGAWDGYDDMAYMLNLGGADADYSGNCDGAAASFGVGDVSDIAESTPWGIGWGPMTVDFVDEIVEGLGEDEYYELGDTAGTAYLRWSAGEEQMLTAWGYFQVIPFGSGDLLLTDEFVEGVRDDPYPSDGYYLMETIYRLTYSR